MKTSSAPDALAIAISAWVFLASGYLLYSAPARRWPYALALGWALVLGGLGYALAWLVLPLDFANLAALLVLLIGVVYAAARISWSLLRHRLAAPHRPG